jgi:hypothetical protein
MIGTRRTLCVVLGTALLLGGSARTLRAQAAPAPAPAPAPMPAPMPLNMTRGTAPARPAAPGLPKNLVEFTEIPIKYRQALFNLLPPDVRATIMRETYEAALASGKLNAAQAAFVREQIPTQTADLYIAADSRAKAIAEERERAKAEGKPFRPHQPDPEAVSRGTRMLELFGDTPPLLQLLSPMNLPQRVPKQVP